MSVFPTNLSRLAIVSLILLRLAVGWHFFCEGRTKWTNQNFSSRHFLQDAKGPFATWYRSLIDDPLELNRLDESAIRESWDGWMTRLEARVSPASVAEIEKELNAAMIQWQGKLSDFFRSLSADLAEYRAIALPTAAAMTDAKRQGQVFEQRYLQSHLAKLQQMRAPWIAELKSMDRLMCEELSGLMPGQSFPMATDIFAGQKSWVDHSVTFLTLAVGVFLLIGCLVPLAAIAGIIFLVSIMLSQPFWVADANLSYAYYQSVEIAALAVLAATAAGRFAGIDYFWMGRIRKHKKI